MNPVNRRPIQSSVADHPRLWHEAIESYYNEGVECLNSLGLRREGLQANYSEELGDFEQGLNITNIGNLRRQALIKHRRERQIQRLALRVTQPNTQITFRDQTRLIQGCKETQDIYDFLIYKLNYRGKPEDNDVFSTPRLKKFFDKIKKDNPKIKDIGEKDADAKPKALRRLDTRKRELEQQLQAKLPQDRIIPKYESDPADWRNDAATLPQPRQGKLLNYLNMADPSTVTLQKLLDCHMEVSDVVDLRYKPINYLFSKARAILIEAKQNMGEIEKLRGDIRAVDNEIQRITNPNWQPPIVPAAAQAPAQNLLQPAAAPGPLPAVAQNRAQPQAAATALAPAAQAPAQNLLQPAAAPGPLPAAPVAAQNPAQHAVRLPAAAPALVPAVPLAAQNPAQPLAAAPAPVPAAPVAAQNPAQPAAAPAGEPRKSEQKAAPKANQPAKPKGILSRIASIFTGIAKGIASLWKSFLALFKSNRT